MVANQLRAQGTEAGGHTGDVATSVLIPQCVDLCKVRLPIPRHRRVPRSAQASRRGLRQGRQAPLHGGAVAVVGAGGIFDGRGVAMALALGAQAVWVGTRFVAAEEAAAGPRHQRAVIKASSDDTVRTLIFSGRPVPGRAPCARIRFLYHTLRRSVRPQMRVQKNDYIMDWESTRPLERDGLLAEGKRPYKTDLDANEEAGTPLDFLATYPNIIGQASGAINEVLPAKQIVHSMVAEAYEAIAATATLLPLETLSKL
jgi:NAD(P)H-dependent flavin oxidoreductase YrpB (nitropropane dioxygenase family)